MVKYISFGKISGLHGLNGEIECECFFENYNYFLNEGEIFLKQNNDYILTKPKLTGVKKDNLMLKIEGFDTKDEARKLLKQELFIKREALNVLENNVSEGYFVADLLGLEVFVEGEEGIYGLVHDIVDFGGGTLFEVELSPFHKRNKNKKEKLEYYEKKENTIKEINLEKGYIMIFVSQILETL